jgi:hypothetical protein
MPLALPGKPLLFARFYGCKREKKEGKPDMTTTFPFSDFKVSSFIEIAAILAGISTSCFCDYNFEILACASSLI